MPAPLGFLFDASQVAPAAEASFGPIPDADYNCVIKEAARVPFKDYAEYPPEQITADMTQLKLVFEIEEGPMKGRLGWKYLGLWNTDAQKCGMAHSDFSSICRAVNVIQVQDAEQLVGRKCCVFFKKQKDSDNSNLRNFKPYAGPAVATAPMGTPAMGFAPAAPGFAPAAPAAPAALAPAPAPLVPPPGMQPNFVMPGQQTQQFAPPMAPAPVAAPQFQPPTAPPGFVPGMAPGFAPGMVPGR